MSNTNLRLIGVTAIRDVSQIELPCQVNISDTITHSQLAAASMDLLLSTRSNDAWGVRCGRIDQAALVGQGAFRRV
ncbi:hypothetical protein [Rubinisphaera italica]|uniref:hypothetical protein n=1 Tax=Rubinisphaera italica TaxID=2527969 RepID=UPI0013EF307E|nr:hypothetical protein [Rubinisphaera italica]